jgi:hypothetical protein
MTTALTLEEALALPAGPDLDHLIAENLLGWQAIRFGRAYKTGADGSYARAEFSTNLERAEYVLDRLIGPRHVLAFLEDGWICGSGDKSGEGETAELAICRLLLKVFYA